MDLGQHVRGQSEDFGDVMILDQLVRGGGRPARGIDWRRLERFTKVRQDLLDPGSVMKKLNRMSPPQAGHAKGNSYPTRAMSLAQAIREVS